MLSDKDFPKYELEGFVSSDDDLFYHVINSIVIPRPIAFVTTKGSNGVVNAAPFSYFNVVCTNPSLIAIAVERRLGQRKDTACNILFLKEFVVNICSVNIAKAVAISSQDFPPEVSEIDTAKLSLLPSQMLSVPRIANTPAQLECTLYRMIELGKDQCDLILGKVVKIHLHKSILNSQGRVDPEKLNPLARISGPTYAMICNLFDIPKNSA